VKERVEYVPQRGEDEDDAREVDEDGEGGRHGGFVVPMSSDGCSADYECGPRPLEPARVRGRGSAWFPGPGTHSGPLPLALLAPVPFADAASTPVEALELLYTLVVVLLPVFLLPLWIRGERRRKSKDEEGPE
jgi:hypothetical protein